MREGVARAAALKPHYTVRTAVVMQKHRPRR